MGGLLIADATLAIADSRLEKTSPLWPRIIACIAFDTPYYGLHPFVFKNQTSKAVTYAQGAHKLATSLGIFGSAADAKSPSGSSTPKVPAEQLALTAPPAPASASSAKGGWTKWAPAALGAVVAGAAAGAAYYKKDELTSSVFWAGDHLKYVGNLWDKQALQRRVDSLIAIERESGVLFHKCVSFVEILSISFC